MLIDAEAFRTLQAQHEELRQLAWKLSTAVAAGSWNPYEDIDTADYLQALAGDVERVQAFIKADGDPIPPGSISTPEGFPYDRIEATRRREREVYAFRDLELYRRDGQEVVRRVVPSERGYDPEFDAPHLRESDLEVWTEEQLSAVEDWVALCSFEDGIALGPPEVLHPFIEDVHLLEP